MVICKEESFIWGAQPRWQPHLHSLAPQGARVWVGPVPMAILAPHEPELDTHSSLCCHLGGHSPGPRPPALLPQALRGALSTHLKCLSFPTERHWGVLPRGCQGRQGTQGSFSWLRFLKAPRLSFQLLPADRSSFRSLINRREVCNSNPHDCGSGAADGGRAGQVWGVWSIGDRGCPRPVLTPGKRVHDTS